MKKPSANAGILTQLGLTPEQVEIYETLLQKGPQTATSISHNTSVQRTYIYSLGKQMVDLGLVTMTKKGRTTLFAAQSPDILLSLAAQQKQRVEQAERALEGILPQLKHTYVSTVDRPVVSYFDGLEGVKKVYNDTLREGQTIYAFTAIANVDPKFRAWQKEYSRRRATQKIEAKVIMASGRAVSEYLSRNTQALREVRVVSKQDFPIQHEINIYGGKVAIMHYTKDDAELGIIIDHHLIAESFKAWFNLAWVAAEKVKI